MKKIDLDYVLKISKELIDIPSVVGFTDEVTKRVEKEIKKYGLKSFYTKKGALIATVDGEDNKEAKMISAHVDTIGGIVKRLKENGRLELTNLGGIIWAGVEGENVTIHAFNGKKYTGTLMPIKSSAHAYGDEARETIRTTETVEVRLDEISNSKDDLEKLGIKIGDCASFEPRTVITESGYIKSRYLDDKLCIGQVFGYLKYLKENKLKPKNKLYIYFSNYEEIGHGISIIPEDVTEFIALDIGIVSPISMGDERKVSIAMKDNKTIYDTQVNRKLINCAEKNKIGYTLDLYNRYGSDASGVVLQMADVRIACIGPSVDGSHHYERTHIDGVKATIELMVAYL